MKMDLETLAKIVEEQVPTARTTCLPEKKQIVVTFTHRLDVEVALLTPWLQNKLKRDDLEPEDLSRLVSDIEEIGGIHA